MSVDIATLGIKVDATDVSEAGVKLETLAGKGAQAEKATRGLTSASGEYDKVLRAILAGIRQNTAAVVSQTQSLTGATTGMNALSAAGLRNASASDTNAAAKNKEAGAADNLAHRLAALKASIDPLASAQDRVNAELAEASALFEAGAMDANQYAHAQQVLGMRQTDLAERQARLNAVLMQTGRATRMSVTDTLNFSRQMSDVGVQLAMGMNPLMIAIQQGPQIYDIMQTSGKGLGDMVKELGLMLGIIRQVEVANDIATAGSAAAAAAKGAEAASNSAVAATATAAAAAQGRLAGATSAAGLAAGEAATANGALAASQAATARGAATASTAMRVALTPMGMAIAAVAGATAVLGAGFMVAANEMEKGAGDVTKELGLTDRQLKRLKEEGTDLGVTFGDVFSGLGTTVKESFTEVFKDEISAIEKELSGLYDSAVNDMKWMARSIVGDLVGAYYVARDTWKMLPAAIAEVNVIAANGIIGLVERMVNAIRRMLNTINAPFNAAAGLLGLGQVIPKMNDVEITRIENPWAGADAARGATARASMAAGRAAGAAAVDNFGERWRSNTMEARRDRVLGDAGDPDKEAKPKKEKQSEASKEYESAIDGAKSYIEALQQETAEIGKNRIEVKRLQTARESAAVTAAAAAMGTNEAIATAKRLTDQMKAEQEAWEKATRSQALKEFRQELQDEADELAFNTRMVGMNNAAREKAIAQREIDIRLRAMERDGIKLTAAEIERETAAMLAGAEARGASLDAAESAGRIATATRDMANAAKEATEGFGDMFGSVGEGFSNLLNTMLDFDARQAESRARLMELNEEYLQGQMSAAQFEFERGRINEDMSRAQVAQYGNMLGAAKTFFNEGSTGWRILEGAERAYRLFQFAMQLKAMVMGKAEAASSVANSGAKAAADGVAAIAKTIASLPFPANLIAGAAVAAALVAFGVKMFKGGGGGGTSAATATAAKQVESYSGPRDEYGAPTSSYSVLKPGRTTVANDNGSGGTFSQSVTGGSASNSVAVSFGDTVLNVNGNPDENAMRDLRQVMAENQRETIEKARQAVAADSAARQSRQRLGGGN